MKRIVFIFSFFALVSSLCAQNFLKSDWKFKTGDQSEWKNPGFNDNNWSAISSGSDWETQGFSNYDGFAWYRQTITIPSKLKQDAQANGGLILKLGSIDDADYTYWNGEQIGKNGEMPPNYIGAYDKLRVYTIPSDKILWDKPNVL